MNIQNLSLTDIRPYARNPRKNDEAVKNVAASIREFGFLVPLVIDAKAAAELHQMMHEVEMIKPTIHTTEPETPRPKERCDYCRGATYTDKPFTVITQMGREVLVQINYCPNCGAKMEG